LYARHGLISEGGIFIDAATSIPHQRMWRRIEARERVDAPDSSK
jgi:hypothetical protein